MDNTLHRVHTFKDVFLHRRDGKQVKGKSNALTTKLMKKQKADAKTYAESWTPSKKPREMNALRDYISPEIDISKELDADFNFLKIHMMSHWAEQVR
jgi:hypothetical protein